MESQSLSPAYRDLVGLDLPDVKKDFVIAVSPHETRTVGVVILKHTALLCVHAGACI